MLLLPVGSPGGKMSQLSSATGSSKREKKEREKMKIEEEIVGEMKEENRRDKCGDGG